MTNVDKLFLGVFTLCGLVPLVAVVILFLLKLTVTGWVVVTIAFLLTLVLRVAVSLFVKHL